MTVEGAGKALQNLFLSSPRSSGLSPFSLKETAPSTWRSKSSFEGFSASNHSALLLLSLPSHVVRKGVFGDWMLTKLFSKLPSVPYIGQWEWLGDTGALGLWTLRAGTAFAVVAVFPCHHQFPVSCS
uniref:Uncharacterized protein n=1 Tax=Molossus molossus TaxID=27622 RepID=A0A7J8GL39_MOLMO|nr:hypothetical protein HJG59_011490 [Molossus molossus]